MPVSGPSRDAGMDMPPGRPSYEVNVISPSAIAAQSVRLKKKRSDLHDQSDVEPRPLVSPSASKDVRPLNHSTRAIRPETTRRSSLRETVKKIFGKRTRSSETTKVQRPQRLGQQPSENKRRAKQDSPSLHPIRENKTPSVPLGEPNHLPRRSLSLPNKSERALRLDEPTPSHVLHPSRGGRFASLGLDSTLTINNKRRQRRATLPSLVFDEMTANILASVVDEKGDRQTRMYADDEYSDRRAPEIGLAISTPAQRQNRRSRSADDMRRMINRLEPARQRDEEIDFWRQSFAGSILHHPILPPEQTDRVDNEYASTVHDQPPDSFDVAAGIFDSSVTEEPKDMQDPIMNRRSDTPVEGERDLMSRIARLELICTRLDRHSAELASHRSSTTAPKIASFSDLPTQDLRTDRQSVSPDYVALYSMIYRERASRRQLQAQVQDLQQTVADLQYQLSQPLIRRSGHHHRARPSSGTMDYEDLVPNYTQLNHNISYTSAPTAQRLTSRFSLSDSLTDSEAARLRGSRETDPAELDASKIPSTSRTAPPYARDDGQRFPDVDGEMF